MPLVFSRDEIREFLAEMGYGELNDDDLDRFIKDLQKLIKAESKQRRRRRLGHTGHTRSEFSSTDESHSVGTEGTTDPSLQSHEDSRPRLLVTPKSRLLKNKPRRVEDTSDFTTSRDVTSDDNALSSTSNGHHGLATSSSKTSGSSMSSGPLRERNVITSITEADGGTQMHKDKTRPSLSTVRQIPPEQPKQYNSRTGKEGTAQAHVSKKTLPDGSLTTRVHHKDAKVVDEKSVSSGSSDSLSDTDLLCLMEHILKNDLSGKGLGDGDNNGAPAKKQIEIPMKIRRDPVALYHWYKTFWDKQKPPGEDRHMQLRWNVRAGTVGRFPCDTDGVPIDYLRLNPVRHKKKTYAF